MNHFVKAWFRGISASRRQHICKMIGGIRKVREDIKNWRKTLLVVRLLVVKNWQILDFQSLGVFSHFIVIQFHDMFPELLLMFRTRPNKFLCQEKNAPTGFLHLIHHAISREKRAALGNLRQAAVSSMEVVYSCSVNLEI